MSIQFDDPVNEETRQRIREAFGEAVASDEKTFLFDNMREIHQKTMKEIANTAKQPATVGLHRQGEIVTLSDGSRYEVTPRGWRRIEPRESKIPLI